MSKQRKQRKVQYRRTTFIGDDHGAVTIYTILIIVPIFIFQAVLIDFVRIKVATMEAEQALRAATRSVLSAYDKRLIDYGLFGVNANSDEQKTIANKVLTNYGTDGDNSNAFQWIVLNTREDQTRIALTYSLGDHRLLHQQILEDMKYKAPIEFSRNLYLKWKGKREEVVQVKEEMHVAEEIDALLKQRENQLEDAFDHVKRMSDRANELHSSYQSRLSDPYTYESSDNLSALVKNDFLYLQGQFERMSEYVHEAEQIERQIEQSWDQEDNETQLSDTYILGHDFYLNYLLSATIPISSFGAFVNHVSALQEGDSTSGYTQGFRDSFQSWFNYRSNEEARRTSSFMNMEKKKEEQRRKINDQMDQTKEAALSQICPINNEEQYKRLKVYSQSYLQLNNSVDEQEYDTGASLEQRPEKYQLSSISFLTNLTSLMETIRDEAFVNEYAMYYFNHRTTNTQLHVNPLQDNFKQHALQEQEVEYILYGLSSCTANRMAAYTEMYMLRFAVRMIEALTDARKAAVGSPLLIILIAAAEGGVKAYQDMERIVKGEDVPVFTKWGAMTMNYADYLRMFLLVHSREDRKLSRIQALIQLNTEIDLLQRPAYVELKSLMTLKLWFVRGRYYEIKKTAAMSY